MRSGAVMALATIFSRLTGFLRTAMIVAALGTQALGDAYNTANTMPNVVYDLLFGGILTSILVPMIVRARERDPRYGEQFLQRLFTLGVLFLTLLTAVAMLLAPVLVDIYGRGFTRDQRHLAILFTLFFLPQILFYGLGALAGAILNTRGRFGAPMWAPVLNNIVVIAMAVVFIAMTTGQPTPSNLSDTAFLLLALGTTGGIVLQTVVLWPALRAVGFRWRPRFDVQRGELGQIGRMAGWTLLYVVALQIANAVVTGLANDAGALAREQGLGQGYGYTPFFNAYQLFQLPYAIVAVSVITALLPRMSEHAAEGRNELVRDDFSSGLRLSSVIMVPGAALMLVLAPEIAVVLFAHGNTSTSDAMVIAHVTQMFAIALLPFSIYQLMLRVFYAFGDTRTPAFIGVVTASANIAMAVTVFHVLPPQRIVIGIGFGFAIANLVGAIVCWTVLRWRLGGLDGGRIATAHVKLLAAAVPAAAFAYGVHVGFDRWLGTTQSAALGALVAGAAGGGVLYLIAARLLRVAEVQTLIGTVTARLPGRG